MVIKTEVCSFSEYRIHPGHGSKYLAKDGKILRFLKKKCVKLGLRKIKAQKIRWTIFWRKKNKKTKIDETLKKKRKKLGKIERGIVGVSKDIIKKEQNVSQVNRQAEREQAIREIKERNQKRIEMKKTQRKVPGKGPVKPGKKEEAKQQVSKQKQMKGKKGNR